MWRRKVLLLGLICASPLLAQNAVVNGVTKQSVVSDSCLSVASISNVDGTITIGNAAGAFTISLNRAHANAWSVTPAASNSAILFNGFPFTAGTATTNWPEVLLQPAGTTATIWSTAGTYLGVNAASGFTGDLLRLLINGVNAFQVTAAGSVNVAGTLGGNAMSVTQGATAKTYATVTNCTSAASPAVCASAPAGAFVIAAGASTVIVNTSSLSNNSDIFIQQESSAAMNTRLGVTCNTTISPWTISSRTAATSFTLSTTVSPVGSPACYQFHIMN